MIRYLKFAFLAVVGLVLFTFALANKDRVTLRLVPDEAKGLLPFTNDWSVPLFVVLLGGVLLGLLIGFVWEWFREYRQRAEAARQSKRLAQLEAQVKALRDKDGDGKDDVLALIENG